MKGSLLLSLLLVGCFSAYTQSTDSLEQALPQAEGAQKVKMMNELFRAYINSDPVKAITYTREALNLAGMVKDDKGMAASYNNLGVAYRNQGALEVSLENYMKSLEIYERIQNGEGIATAKNNIANIYSMKKDYHKALKFFEESHAGFVALGDPARIVGSMNNLGNLHADLNMPEQALKYYTEAYKLSEQYKDPFADQLINIGNLNFRQGNPQRAVEYYLRALDLVKKQNNRVGEVSLLTNIGTVFMKANQPVPAKEYLDEALALAKELGADLYTPQILKGLAGTYARQNNYKAAYETLTLYDEAEEKVYGEQSSKKIAQMETALELREKEKEIEALYLNGQMKTLELRNTQIVVVAVVLGLAAIIAFANLFMISRRKIR